ncbi:MAG: antiterminator LoaP [Hungatella sp.]|nr:antiterminator LoaP [Hungatella sp.]
MWYVIQTLGGQEEKTAEMIRNIVKSDFIEECFIPKRERLKKFQGSWNKVEEILFHGYVFVVSKESEEMYKELKQVPKLTKLLGRETDYFFALSDDDKELVERFGNREHKTSLSRVMVREGNQIQVIDGPLKGYVGNIVKINLHKREVIVRVEFMERRMELKMGIEMVSMVKK